MKKICLILLTTVSILSAADDKDITAYHRKTFGAENFNKRGVAHIITEEGWVAINRKKKILYRPFIFDNGPDYVQEGLLRFVENGKMGFANEAGKKVIPAQFDFVYPFEKGRARFCNGCKAIKDGEHSMMDEKTGTWGEIDKKGRVQK
ncbi:MAG: WG repeat-containing protein [Turneriella sp.]